MMDHQMAVLRDVMRNFRQIEQARGRQKAEILKELHGTATQKYLRILLNPEFVSHIDKKSLEKVVDLRPLRRFCDLLDVCVFLHAKQAISHQDIADVQGYIWSLDSDLHDFVRSFLQKSIKLGVSVKTYNKCFPDDPVIDTSCMLAKKYYECPHVVDGREFAITEKLDGIRCLAVLRRGRTPKLYSRQNKLIKGLTDIYRNLRTMQVCGVNDCVLDGELLISNRDGIPSKEQYKRTTKIVMSDEPNKQGITFHVFDYIPIKEFDCHDGQTPYELRRYEIDTLIADCDMEFVKPVPLLYQGNDTSMIHRLVNQQISLGHEGVMINLIDEPYVFGRTNALLKVKVMQDADLRIIALKQGEGKFSGTLGAIVVDWKGAPVGVGSGLSNEMRDEIWSNQERYIGRVAKVRYFEETHNKDGVPSIRFPVFEEIREMGKEVSYH